MTFANPALLWGLGLISIPIIIHLLNRRRFVVVQWAPMEFLLAAVQENKKRVKLEHLIVLLLRCLAVALIALLLCRPLASESGLGFLPGASESIERVVIIDDSGSMAYRTGRSTSFERARTALEKLINSLREKRPRDPITVIRASRSEAPDLLRASVGDAVAIDGLLTTLKEGGPSSEGMDLVELVDAALTRKDSDDAPKRRVVYVLTDLRRRDWVGPRGEAPRRLGDVLRKHQGEVEDESDPPIRLLIGDFSGGETQRNVGIVAIEPREKLAMAGVPLELAVTVRNYGTKPVQNVSLMLESGQGRLPLRPIARIEPGKEQVVRTTYTILEPGARAITAKLAEDELPLDDARYLALRVQDRIKALLVNGEEGSGPLDDETDLLKLALSPSDDSLSGVEPTVVLPQALVEEDLSTFTSIMVCNLARWTPEQVKAIEQFVRRGGGLAIFLGDQVDRQSYDDLLYKEGEGLLPCKLGQRVAAETDDDAVRLAPPSTEHPLTKVFGGEDNPFLTRVRARVRLSLGVDKDKDKGTQVVLRLDDEVKTPFVLEKSFGKGKVVLFNTTADRGWSSWPGKPTFLISCQELVRMLASSATEGRNLRCGEPLLRPINPARFLTTGQLAVPDKTGKLGAPRVIHAQTHKAATDDDEGGMAFSYPETGRAGVYSLTLETQTKEQRVEFFAINLDASEGDLTRANTDQIRPGLDGIAVEFAQGGAEADLLARTDGTRTELWRTFLALLLLVLVIEQVLAWRAAHHKTPVAPPSLGLGGAA